MNISFIIRKQLLVSTTHNKDSLLMNNINPMKFSQNAKMLPLPTKKISYFRSLQSMPDRFTLEHIILSAMCITAGG
ncbi:MAG: hypothetical protein COA99_18770 [Moraxellaceae bacterium]|nr:MAG: hypothetical protein COA99_18770 [Moraxellaceae bacterium]